MINFDNVEKRDFFEDVMTEDETKLALLKTKISVALLKERIRMDLGQHEFAKMLGVSQGLISRWEQGEYNFTLKKLVNIFSKLDIDIDIEFKKKSDVPDVYLDEVEWDLGLKKINYSAMLPKLEAV